MIFNACYDNLDDIHQLLIKIIIYKKSKLGYIKTKYNKKKHLIFLLKKIIKISPNGSFQLFFFFW